MRRVFSMALFATALSIATGAGASLSDKAKGGGGSSTGGGSTGNNGGVGPTHDAQDTLVGTDDEAEARRAAKPWFVDGEFEYHHLIRQNDLGGDQGSEGDAANRNFNYLLLTAGYDFSSKDRLTVMWGVYQRFLADPGESGIRSDDGVVAYTRAIPLGSTTTLRIQPRVTIPLSFASTVLAGMIISPRLSAYVDQRIGRWVTLSVLGYAEYYVMKYASYAGGAANPQTNLAALVTAEMDMPFLPALTAGITVFGARTTFYEVSNGMNYGTVAQYGTTPDPLVPNQPANGSYGGEAYVRYDLPKFVTGLQTSLRAAYAEGDGTLGYQPLLHDGVGRFDLFYRHYSELYFTLIARY